MLEQYEQEADAAEQRGSLESTKMLADHDLGEPRPSISTNEDRVEERESARDKADISKPAIILPQSNEASLLMERVETL